ncbi:MAG: L-threonylcarbamoyladenylate synthase [Methanomassiliicoccus sp.]|nr:L-threonylcarbamoyladenylate synthase [Methanomassiliicoccus sp.]
MEIIKCELKDGVPVIPESRLKQIVSELAAGRLIVYPTETVYGLGCDPFDETAVKRIYMAKRRPFDMAMSIMVKDLQMMEEVGVLDERSRRLVNKFMPGPLTIIVPKRPNVPDILTASTNEIGIRIPDNAVAMRLIEEFGPLVTTSANVHSHGNPRTCQEALDDLGASVSLYLDGGPTVHGKPSTIIQLTDQEITLIRPGALSPDTIKAALDE